MNRLELRLIGSYVVWYWAFVVLLILLALVSVLVFDYDLLSGPSSSVVSALAATIPGALYFKSRRIRPPSGFSWKMAGYFFILQMIFEYFKTGIVFGFGRSIELLTALLSSTLGLSFILFIYCFQFIATRVFFSLGATNEEKRQAKLFLSRQ